MSEWEGFSQFSDDFEAAAEVAQPEEEMGTAMERLHGSIREFCEEHEIPYEAEEEPDFGELEPDPESEPDRKYEKSQMNKHLHAV